MTEVVEEGGVLMLVAVDVLLTTASVLEDSFAVLEVVIDVSLPLGFSSDMFDVAEGTAPLFAFRVESIDLSSDFVSTVLVVLLAALVFTWF